jgi:hypothetical protein
MTRAEFGVPAAPAPNYKSAPNLRRRYGMNPTAEQEALFKQELAAFNKTRRQETKAQKEHTEKSNAHLGAVKQAIADGRDVPARVLAEYPWIKRDTVQAAASPEAAPEPRATDTYADDDGALEALRDAGFDHVQYHSDLLPDLGARGVIGLRTCIGGEIAPEPAYVRVMGWRWTPRVRRVGVMGPQPPASGNSEPGWFWYVTSDLHGILRRKGHPDREYGTKNIFAYGYTRRAAVDAWLAKYRQQVPQRTPPTVPVHEHSRDLR